MVKCLPAVQETRVWSLGWEDPLQKEMATHSSTLAWKIPWREEPGELQPMGLQSVGHSWATSLSKKVLGSMILSWAITLRPQPPSTNEFSSHAPRFWNFELLEVKCGSLCLYLRPLVWGPGPCQHFLNKLSPCYSLTVRLGANNTWQFVTVIMMLRTFQMAFPFLSRRTMTYLFPLMGF